VSGYLVVMNTYLYYISVVIVILPSHTVCPVAVVMGVDVEVL